MYTSESEVCPGGRAEQPQVGSQGRARGRKPGSGCHPAPPLGAPDPDTPARRGRRPHRRGPRPCGTSPGLPDTNTDVYIQGFLRARLAEGEAQHAEAMAWIESQPAAPHRPPKWPRGPEHREAWSERARTSRGTSLAAVVTAADPVYEHICAWDPERIGAVLQALRGILTDHALTEGAACQRCVLVLDGRPVPVAWPCATVRMLTWPWASHPEFDDAWLD